MLKTLLLGACLARPTSLRPWRLLLLLLTLLLGPVGAWAQLTGPKTIGVDYPTVAAAITALNAQGVGAGGVTFNVPAGYAETFALPTAGAITATGTSSNPVIFQKSGTGANPVITAGVGTSTTADAIISLNASDYVTFNGLNLVDPPSNINATLGMEFGFLLGRTGTGATLNGCNNNSIVNCSITLQRAYTTGTSNFTPYGIFGTSGTVAVPFTTLSPTSATAAGQSSNNIIQSNAIQNVNGGIWLQGVVDVTPFTNYDQNNSVGSATAGTGNTIQNYGGTTAVTAYGVRLQYQNNVVASYNTMNNTAGGGVPGISTLYGINLGNGTNTTSTLNNNTVTLTEGAVANQVGGIYNATAGTGALTINGNTFNLTSTASTGTFYNCYNSGSFTTTGATVLSFSNNTIAHTATGAASNTFYGFYNTGTIAGTSTVNGNTFLNAANTVTSTGALAFWFNSISSSSTGPINFQNNQWSLNRTGASGTVSGYINNGSPTGTHNFSGNTFSNITLAGTTAFNGFYVNTATSQLQNITNNTLNNIAGGSGSTYGMYIVYGANNSVISGNTITNLSGTGTTYGLATGTSSLSTTFLGGNVFGNTVGAVSSSGASSVVYGMSLASFTNNVNWYNNKVYNISESGATGAAYGMYVAGGTTNTIYNNLVGNITAPVSTSLNAAVGLFINSSTTVNAYYNTIYLNASSTGATFGTSGVYLGSTTPTLTLTDNIIVNTSTAVGTGGYTAAFRRVSGTAGTAPLPANYATASNNNLFWAGTPSAANLIYVEGITSATTTNPQQTLATYQAFMGSPRDAASKTENPPFLSTTGAASTFLHINTIGATQVESGGIPISGITADFDGDTRNTTTPDIGADEGTFTPNDQTPPTIAYAALGSTGSTTNRTLTATITDASGVATGTGAPLIYYRNSTLGGSYFSAVATGVSGSAYTFTINYANIGGTPASGNVIQYYVAAQDASINNNSGTSPSGGSGITPPGSTAPGTPNSYTILPTLAAGTYYVGTSTACGAPTYATLTAAAAAYNGNGLGGAITFVLVDNTYPSETYPIVFNANGDASATNTLTIKPCSSANPVFSGTSAGALIQLNGAQYVTVDGSNNGTTSQSWSLANSTGSGASLVQLVSNASGAAPASNTVKNLVLTGAASTTTFTTSFGIQMAVASPATTGATNNTFQNNAITKVQTGISAVGLSTTVRDVNTTITGNQIGSATAAAGFGGTAALGITASNQNTLSITGNVVRNPVIVAAGATATGATALISSSTLIGIDLTSNVATATVSNNTVRDLLTSGGTTSASVAGIRVGSGSAVTGATFNANLVTNVKTTNTGGYGAYGIAVNTGTTNAATLLSNNMVSDINGSNYSDFSNSSSAGIYLTGTQSGISIVYNSVNMYGTSTYSSAVNTAALAVESGSTGLTVRNNVLANSIVGSTTGSLPYSLFSNAPAAAYTVINNNDYYSSGTQATDPVIFRINGTNGTTLAALKVATGQDAASISATPTFTTPNDLHTGAMALNAAGAPVAGITADFDGQTRDATVPDIGADEFTPPADDAGVAAITQPVAPFAASVQNIAVQVKNYGAATLNTVTVSYTVNGVAQTPQPLTGLALAPGATSNDLVISTYDFSVGGPSFVIVATTSLPNGNTDSNTTNDAFTRTTAPALCGNYNVGVSQPFVTLDAAVAALNARGASCAVTFTLMDATYPATSGIIINQYPGISSVNTLTIKPGTGVTAAITGSVAGAIIKINGAQYVTLDGSNNGSASQNWSLANGTGSGASLVQLGSNATGMVPANNTVKNLVLTGAASVTTFTTSFGIQLAVASPATTGATNNTFQNNAITKVQTGISAVGLSTAVRDVNTTITGNQIGSATAAAGFGGTAALGITASNQNTLTITGNVVRNPVIVAAGATATGATALISSSTLIGIDLNSNVATATVSNNTVRDLLTSGGSGASSPLAGVRLGTAVTGVTVNASLITNIKATSTGGYGGYGIYVNTATASTGDVVSNNMVSDINGSSNYSAFSNSSSAGIYLSGTQSGISLVYNSVNMYGTSTYASAVNTAALAVESGSTGLTVQNNVLANSIVGSTAGSLPYSLFSNAPAAAYTVINNNDYYSSGTQATDPVIFRINGTNGTTLAALKAATTQDAVSISIDPSFISANDLHTNVATLDGAGATVAGITTDFDGQTRNATTPDIGADEFTPITVDLAPTALATPTTTQGCYGPTETVTVTVRNQGVSTLDFTVNPASVTVNVTGAATATLTGSITTGTLAPGATRNVTLAPTLNMSAFGTYTFAINATVTGDLNTANDNLTPNPAITTVAPVAGTIAPASTTICNSGTATLTLTGSANGSIQYQQSPDNVTFTNVATGGTTATYTTPVLTSTTYYRAQTICGANVVTSNVATVTVNTPLITSASPTQTICSGSTATVTANGSSGTTVRFFANATGGTALTTGTAGAATASYTTPTLTANTPYYAEAFASGTEVVGKTAPNTTGSLTSGGLIFNVTGATTLKTVTVYSIGASGTVSIQLQNAAGTVLQTGTGTVAAGTASVPAASVITLNFNLVTGTGYKLIQGGGTSMNLVRDDNTAGNNSFPYASPSGNVTITDGTLSGYYYFFYNWQISNECASAARTPVQVTVNPQPTFTTTHANASCFGSSTGSITVSATGGVAGGTYEYSKNNGTTYQASNVFSSLAAGTYQVVVRNVGGTQCAAPAQAVTITQPASALAVTATKTDETAAGNSDGTVTGTATGGTSPYYYSLNSGAFSTANVFSGLAPGPYTLTVTDAGGCAATSNTVTVGPGACTTNTWNGTVSTDWFTPGNWSCGQIPTATIDAAIPAGLTNYPNLTTTATAAVRTLTIANGASLSQSAGILNVYGDLTNSTAVSNVSLTGGTMAFLGTMPNITGSLAMYDLTTNLSSPSGVLTLSSNITVQHVLTLTQGVLNTGTAYVVTLPVGATVTETDASYVLGHVAAPSRTLVAGTAESFGGIGLTLTPAAGSLDPGLTPVVRTTGTVLTGVGTSVSIKRYFDIQPATNTGLNVAMDFSYLDHERNGLAAASLNLFKSVSGTGGPWSNQGPVAIAANMVSKTGITDFSIWTLGSSTSPLPVALTAFTAERQGTNANLTWTTASEKNSAGFEVQLSTDGRSYRALGFVASASPGSTSPRHYALLDTEKGKTGLRYYRLKQVDLNGAAEYSPVRSVRFEGDAVAGVRLLATPVPFHESLTLTVQLPAGTTATSAQVLLTDAAGRTVLTVPGQLLSAGENQLPALDLHTLASGVYIVHLALPGQPTQHLKVVKE